MEWEKLQINAQRLQENFEALAIIGSTGDGGVHRPALSEAHLQARAWLGDTYTGRRAGIPGGRRW